MAGRRSETVAGIPMKQLSLITVRARTLEGAEKREALDHAFFFATLSLE